MRKCYSGCVYANGKFPLLCYLELKIGENACKRSPHIFQGGSGLYLLA